MLLDLPGRHACQKIEVDMSALTALSRLWRALANPAASSSSWFDSIPRQLALHQVYLFPFFIVFY